jgi:parallel beta-helix repeat protein
MTFDISNATIVSPEGKFFRAGDLINDVATTNVTATDATVARSLSDHFADSANIKDFGGLPDGTTNTVTALNAAKAAGVKTVIFDEGDEPYAFPSGFTFSSGMRLVAGRGSPTLRMDSASTSRMLLMPGVTDCHLIGLTIDGASCAVRNDSFVVINSGSTLCSVRDCRFVDPPAGGVGSVVISGVTTRDNAILRNRFENSYDTAIGVSAACSNQIEGNQLFTTGGFGIRIGEAAHRNAIIGNRSETSTLEAVGVYWDAEHNRIIGNHCEDAGDNGISITGAYNVVSGNQCIGNYGAGIGIWGKFNTITGNLLLNNGTSNPQRLWDTGQAVVIGDQRIHLGLLYTATTNGTTGGSGPVHTSGTASDGAVTWQFNNYVTYWSGVWVSVGFGGTGQYNTISGNTFDDNQTIPTQYFSVRIEGSGGYTAWAAGQSITTGLYRTSGVHIYKAASSGTTALAAPSHTSGTVADGGGVSWTYINSFINTNAPRNCVVSGNVSGRQKAGVNYSDAANWVANTLYAHQQINVTHSVYGLILSGLPTSSSGLTTGMLWNDSGTVKIVS